MIFSYSKKREREREGQRRWEKVVGAKECGHREV
jgi:hypothetical protein